MTLLQGDCLEKLKELPDNSVDSIVTDPPYGIRFMGKAWDGADIEKVLKRDKSEGDTKTSISMAAGKYDLSNKGMIAFQEFSFQWAKECLRVLKPGGHLLAFASCRTYHRMAVGVEMAGFEIRDQIQWLFGSGFPKSHDVSKGIDKQAGVERETYERPAFGGNFSDDNGTTYGTAISNTPSTDAAKQWQGWGTALKPANEPIVVARKPLEKGLTIAQNVMKWGTGALNIDASRIEISDKLSFGSREIGDGNKYSPMPKDKQTPGIQNSQGRWPANVIFDEEAAAVLDGQSGLVRHSQPFKKLTNFNFDVNGKNTGQKFEPQKRFLAGASRFFYVAKASKRERNAGLEVMPKVSSGHLASETGGGGGWSADSDKNPNLPRENFHPTVKPIKLMEYLITLVTPPNGSVLDPFMGSGSTGVAAKNLGREFIGIELSPEYFAIAQKRITA